MEQDELDNFPTLSSNSGVGTSVLSLKKDIDAVAKHSDLLTRAVHSSNKKLETLSKIVIGNGEVRQSVIWNLEGVKSEIFQISKNIEALTKKVEEIHSATISKLDNIATIETKILAIEKTMSDKDKASDTFKGRYLAPILVAVTTAVIIWAGSFVFSLSRNASSNSYNDKVMSKVIEFMESEQLERAHEAVPPK